MSRAQKIRRKRYQPRPILRLGGLSIIAGQHAAAEDNTPIVAEDQTDLHIAYRLAFEAMCNGASSEENWSVVVVSLNVALILSERGIGHEYEPYLVKALDGAFLAKIRAGRHGVWRFDGPAINDIRTAFEIHEEQIRLTTKAEVRSALQEVYNRINQGHIYREAA
jgi:hypothetical protein